MQKALMEANAQNLVKNSIPYCTWECSDDVLLALTLISSEYLGLSNNFYTGALWNNLMAPQNMVDEYYRHPGITPDFLNVFDSMKNQKMVDGLELKSDSTTKDVHWMDEHQISVSKLGKEIHESNWFSLYFNQNFDTLFEESIEKFSFLLIFNSWT